MADQIDLLMVEDDEYIIRAWGALLVFIGHKTHFAKSIDEAIFELGFNPQAITIDLSLNGQRGEDLIGIVRQKLPDAKVFIWTGEPDGPRLDAARALADDVFVKGKMNIDEIINKLPRPRTITGGLKKYEFFSTS